MQAALALSTTLVSPKFSKKINYCATLAELRDKLGVQLDLPNFVVYEFPPFCSFLLFLLPFVRSAQSPCFPTTLTILHSVNTMGRCDSRCSIWSPVNLLCASSLDSFFADSSNFAWELTSKDKVWCSHCWTNYKGTQIRIPGYALLWIIVRLFALDSDCWESRFEEKGGRMKTFFAKQHLEMKGAKC